MSDITTTTAQLTAELASKADAIAVRVSSVEKEMEQICMDVATDCENLESETAYAYLKRAFPEITDKANRRRYLNAGLMLNEGGRRRLPCKPPWTVAAEAYSLSPAGYEWFFSQEEPPTRSAVREYKSKERARKHRANEQIPQDGKRSPTDDSQSSQPTTLEIVNHVTDVQPGNTSTSISEGVPNVQSSMDTNSNRCDKGAVPVDTTNDGRAAEDHAEVNRLIGEINTIFKRHYAPFEPGTFDGVHWTNFYHHFHSLCGTCEQYSREYRSQEKEYYDGCLDNAKEWCDSISGGRGEDSDGQILRLLR